MIPKELLWTVMWLTSLNGVVKNLLEFKTHQEASMVNIQAGKIGF